MAYPTCPKCDNHIFELRELSPLGSSVKLNTVQCTKCGAVVGVTDYYNTASLLFELAKKLGVQLTP